MVRNYTMHLVYSHIYELIGILFGYLSMSHDFPRYLWFHKPFNGEEKNYEKMNNEAKYLYRVLQTLAMTYHLCS